MATLENCIEAEKTLGRNKPDNKMARHIAANPEKYAESLLEKIRTNSMNWHEPRKRVIKESYKGKERNLKIPCLEDQAAQIAWLNIATKYIMQHNYYYNCGSVPGAGQTRCIKALQRKLRKKKYKYAAVLDIRKFYDSCPHYAIEQGLMRIFKDKRFVDFAMQFVKTMSDTERGIAIGYPSSHWLANVALMRMDHQVVRNYPDVFYMRYMDDMVLISSNKRHLKRAVAFIRESLREIDLHIKQWNVFKIADRGITFLSYRFFKGYTLLAKKLMIRIARRMKKAAEHMCGHVAAGILSYLGILKWCDSYNFRRMHAYPYVNVNLCKRLVSIR